MERSPPSSSPSALGARETVVLAREDAADRREDAADRREDAADRREDAADLRDTAADEREATNRAATQHRANKESHLREANEQLVVTAVHAQTMVEAAEHATLQMSFKAERDFLTGLPNRALLTDRLAQSIALAIRHGKRLAVLYVDLDNFKGINDSFGHSVGDQLLQSAAKRLEHCIRHSDTVSRHGGDEFVVLLSEVESVQDAACVSEKLIKAMAKPHLVGDHPLNVTLSIGISLFPDDAGDAETILTNADIAMYDAKRVGGNNYKRFTPDMNATSVERPSLHVVR
jgi:diguanylate cyclase (GGDEF)-like protein